MPSEIKPYLVLVGKSTIVKKLLKHNKLVLPAYNGLRLLCSMYFYELQYTVVVVQIIVLIVKLLWDLR